MLSHAGVRQAKTPQITKRSVFRLDCVYLGRFEVLQACLSISHRNRNTTRRLPGQYRDVLAESASLLDHIVCMFSASLFEGILEHACILRISAAQHQHGRSFIPFYQPMLRHAADRCPRRKEGSPRS
ncbi:hypothetical protein IG631_22467 [Alternaria alternata]|nr:hypothetical protein IG631_22467 [Alternaria alternata]